MRTFPSDFCSSEYISYVYCDTVINQALGILHTAKLLATPSSQVHVTYGSTPSHITATVTLNLSFPREPFNPSTWPFTTPAPKAESVA